MKKWYRSWFNSPYYHILYANRDHKEAEHFIDALVNYFNIKENDCVLDACCGKGRHSIYLNKRGIDVTGIDLAQESIAYAKKFENSHLHFYEHDIRNLLSANYFDFVFNLFTSFGYFRRENEDIKAIKAFAKNLKPGGILLIDFLNVGQITNSMQAHDEKHIDGILFKIQKKIENGLITKHINFDDKGCQFAFKEEVKALRLADFQKYFDLAGLTLIEKFGSYQLEPFHIDSSDRLIMVAQKPL